MPADVIRALSVLTSTIGVLFFVMMLAAAIVSIRNANFEPLAGLRCSVCSCRYLT